MFLYVKRGDLRLLVFWTLGVKLGVCVLSPYIKQENGGRRRGLMEAEEKQKQLSEGQQKKEI